MPFLGFPGGLNEESAGRSVLYFDGELGEEDIHYRCNEIKTGFPSTIGREYLYIQTPQDCGGFMWNLADPEHQALYTELCKEDEVIIIDNILTCSGPLTARDDDVQQWRRIQRWAVERKNAGQSVIFVHHAGKSGQQLGTSQRENIMDHIINIKRIPMGYDEKHDNFAIRFDKLRGYFGPERHGMYARASIASGALKIEHSPLDDILAPLVQNLYEDLGKWHLVAAELDIPMTELGRIKKLTQPQKFSINW